MQYVNELVANLEQQLPWGSIEPEERRIFSCFYALLALTAPARIDAESVHNAWVCAMTALGRTNPSMVPFQHLDPEMQARDEPFAAALESSTAAFHSLREV